MQGHRGNETLRPHPEERGARLEGCGATCFETHYCAMLLSMRIVKGPCEAEAEGARAGKAILHQQEKRRCRRPPPRASARPPLPAIAGRDLPAPLRPQG